MTETGSHQARTSKRAWFTDTGWLLGANLVRNLGLIVVMIVLARLTEPAVVGRYSLALAITAPIFVFSQLGLKGVYLTHRRERKFSRYISVQIASLLVALIVSLAVTMIADPTLAVVVALVGLVKLSDAISDLFIGPLQAFSATPWVFWGTTASAVFGAAAGAWCLVVTGNLELTLLALAAASAVGSAAFMWVPGILVIRRRDHAPESRAGAMASYRAIVRAGLPSGIGGAVLALVASAPQYFLAANWGSSAVAQYAVLYYTVMVADIFVGTLAQGWIPRAREASTNRSLAPQGFFRFTLKTSLTWSLIMLPVALIGIALAALLLPLLFGPEYRMTLGVAIPIAAAILIMPILNFASMAIIVLNLYIHAITVSAVSAAASLALGAILIPIWGVQGAFWTFALAAAFRALPGLILVQRSERREDPV